MHVSSLPACIICTLTKGTTSFARGESLRPRSELDALTIKSMNSSMYTALKTTSLHVQSLIVVLSSFTVLSISSIRSTTFSSKASLSSNSLTCVLNADQSPAGFRDCWVDIAHVHALQNNESAYTCQSRFTMHKCTFNELAIPPFPMRYPSKMPKKNYLHSCDCARCKRRYTFSYSTVRRHRTIYGVESGATVPETASTTACANATVDSNSSTSVIADRKVL